MAERPIPRRQVSGGPAQTTIDEARRLANDTDRTVNRWIDRRLVGPWHVEGIALTASANMDLVYSPVGAVFALHQYQAIRRGRITAVTLYQSEVNTAGTIRYEIYNGSTVIVDHQQSTSSTQWIEEFPDRKEYYYNKGDIIGIAVISSGVTPTNDIDAVAWLEIGFKPSENVNTGDNVGSSSGGGYWFPPDV